MSLPAMLASVVRCDHSESSNPYELVDASD
jgi:hypothetical protein